jgi:hypothetical protein
MKILLETEAFKRILRENRIFGEWELVKHGELFRSINGAVLTLYHKGTLTFGGKHKQKTELEHQVNQAIDEHYIKGF